MLKESTWFYCKDVFISATWTVILGRFHFQFTTCYLSSVTAMTTHITVSSITTITTIPLPLDDYFVTLTIELPSAGNTYRRNMQKPESYRFSEAVTSSVAVQLTQTDWRHPFVIHFFFSMCQASEGADYIYAVNKLPNSVSNFTSMLHF